MICDRINRRSAVRALALMGGGALALRTGPLLAQGMDQTGGTTRFVRVASAVSTFETESGQLALQSSANAGVRGFAARMMKDHADLFNSLRFTNDSNAGAPLRRDLSEQGRDMVARLRTTAGADFDVLYMDMQVRTLADALAVYQEYSRVGSVEGLRRHAVKYAPMLEEHVHAARTVRGSLTP